MVTLLPSAKVMIPPDAAEITCELEATVPAIVTGNESLFVVSATAVAVMLTLNGVGTAFGAVYSPFTSTVPIVPFPPATPFTAQLTNGSKFPVP